MSGYRSSKAQISSRVRTRFVIFILKKIAQIIIAGKRSASFSCLLAKAMREGFAFDEEMIGHPGELQDFLLNGGNSSASVFRPTSEIPMHLGPGRRWRSQQARASGSLAPDQRICRKEISRFLDHRRSLQEIACLEPNRTRCSREVQSFGLRGWVENETVRRKRGQAKLECRMKNAECG